MQAQGLKSQGPKNPLMLNSVGTTQPTTPHNYQSNKTYSSTPKGDQNITYTSHTGTRSHRESTPVQQGISHSYSQPSVLKYTPTSTANTTMASPGNTVSGYAGPPRGLGAPLSQSHPHTNSQPQNNTGPLHSSNTFSRPGGQTMNGSAVNTPGSSANKPAGKGLSLRSNR